MAGCRQVYHVAGIAKLWAPDRRIFYEVNVNGTRHVLQEALAGGVEKMVYTSSCAVFGTSLDQPLCETDPRIIGLDNDYDLSKVIAEKLVMEYNQKGVVGCNR